jgi:hypothetical protein
MTPEDTSHSVTHQQLRDALDHAVGAITAAIQTGAAQLRTEIQAAQDRAQEFARGIETNLLTAFHGHAKGQTARLHTAELTAHDMGIRIAALEERVLNIETRQRPPQ